MAYDNECNLVVLINVNSTNHYAQAPRSFCDWKHQHFAKTFANREKWTKSWGLCWNFLEPRKLWRIFQMCHHQISRREAKRSFFGATSPINDINRGSPRGTRGPRGPEAQRARDTLTGIYFQILSWYLVLVHYANVAACSWWFQHDLWINGHIFVTISTRTALFYLRTKIKFTKCNF